MSNSLLVNLFAYYDMKTAAATFGGFPFTTIPAGYTFGHPGPVAGEAAVLFPDYIAPNMETDPVGIAWNSVDVSISMWGHNEGLDPTPNGNVYSFGLADDVSDLTWIYAQSIAAGLWTNLATISGSDDSYPAVYDFNPIPDGWNQFGLRWNHTTRLMELILNGSVIGTGTFPVGMGPFDATTYIFAQSQHIALASCGIWRTSLTDAQFAALFDRLPFSQWDSGGAGNNSSSTGGRSGIVIAPDQRLPQGVTVTTRDLRRATPIRSYGRGRR